MKVLVACECSGRVRDAFRELGHDAMSCDLVRSEVPGPHHTGDVRDVLNKGWDMMIAHPPCTYLSRAGARWWNDRGRAQLANAAADFVYLLRDANIPRIAIENPIGQLNWRWRYPDQTIQPWWFGDPFSKATCLWLKGLPPLIADRVCETREPLLPSNTGKGRRNGEKWHRGHTSDPREAARTFPGIARAMAEQWSSFIEKQAAA